MSDAVLCHACQQPLTGEADALEAPTPLNERYEILTEVGSGGFGAVYKARDLQEQAHLVAVKQINLKGLSSQEIIEATDAFNREAEILTSLRHPLLPRIYDRFSDPEHWYLVMNFIEGETLDAYLDRAIVEALPSRRGLSLDETLGIGLDLCDVLHYLHTQQPPVIFRDLKPGNIMRTTRGSLYLIDFGIARRFKPGQAKDTIPFGSPGFAAPEQYGRAQTTPRADIYSLGALLYCLLSGDDPSEHPFQFPPLRLPGADGLRELEALISRMVSLSPEQRPAGIQAVRAELQRIQQLRARIAQQGRIWIPPQGQTPQPLFTANSTQQHLFQTPSAHAQPATPRKTTRRRVLTIGLLAGGAALVGGVALVRGNQGQQIPASPVNLDTNNTGVTSQDVQSTEDAIYSAPGRPAFWSPDLTHNATVYADIHSMGNKVSLYANQGRQLLRTLDLPALDPAMTVFWSQNNQRVILVESAMSDGTVWEVQNGRQLSTIQASWQSPTSPIVWSPDGNYLAIAADSQSLLLINAAHGETLLQQNLALPIASTLAWMPDSHSVLIPVVASSASADTWTIEMWSSQTDQRIGVIANLSQLDASDLSDFSYLACAPSGKQYAFTYQNGLWLGNLSDARSAYQLARFTDSNPETYGTVSSLAWSPDEQYLAILFMQSVSVWNASTGKAVPLGNTNAQGDINAFAWAADSKSLIVADGQNIVSHWSLR